MWQKRWNMMEEHLDDIVDASRKCSDGSEFSGRGKVLCAKKLGECRSFLFKRKQLLHKYTNIALQMLIIRVRARNSASYFPAPFMGKLLFLPSSQRKVIARKRKKPLSLRLFKYPIASYSRKNFTFSRGCQVSQNYDFFMSVKFCHFISWTFSKMPRYFAPQENKF